MEENKKEILIHQINSHVEQALNLIDKQKDN